MDKQHYIQHYHTYAIQQQQVWSLKTNCVLEDGYNQVPRTQNMCVLGLNKVCDPGKMVWKIRVGRLAFLIYVLFDFLFVFLLSYL